MKRHLLLSSLLLAASFGAHAQHAAALVQHDLHHQRKIEQGLLDGSITGREAAVLQRQQGRIDRLEARALRDGWLSDRDRARLAEAHREASLDIRAAARNDEIANPRSLASRRALADVRRNLRHEHRIRAGIRDGSLTDREVAALERGQARVHREEYAAGRDGHVSDREQSRIDRVEDWQSERIHQQKNDDQRRGD